MQDEGQSVGLHRVGIISTFSYIRIVFFYFFTLRKIKYQKINFKNDYENLKTILIF